MKIRHTCLLAATSLTQSTRPQPKQHPLFTHSLDCVPRYVPKTQTDPFYKKKPPSNHPYTHPFHHAAKQPTSRPPVHAADTAAAATVQVKSEKRETKRDHMAGIHTSTLQHFNKRDREKSGRTRKEDGRENGEMGNGKNVPPACLPAICNRTTNQPSN
ncbi:hypothetical protein IWX90DRAFT_154991 [Phyllosticta citrichinensis]|uniref:Uncharacterized protein n=1 Tax=Phyllosticta citrichinensis TaxID=1130410 RepID=A0ABR1XZW1_9PEZI